MAFLLGLTVLWSLVAGKDLNFDFRNYHLYSAYAFLHDRLGMDYFPAAVSGYLNPLAEVPIYAMIMAQWDDRVIALVLALSHFPVFWFVWKIAELITADSKINQAHACVASAILAFLSPIQLTTLSNSFADPSAGFFTIAGIYLLLKSSTRTNDGIFLLAGVMFGVGAGLKLTNLILIPGAFIALLFVPGPRGTKMKLTLILAIGCALGFLITNGWWAAKLYAHFGNPIYPLYNSIFKSPDFINSNFSDRRMLIYGAWTWLALPFLMLKSGTMIYSENSSPDIRIFLLVLSIAGAIIFFAVRKIGVGKPGAESPAEHRPLARKILLIYFAVSYVLWGTLSGIGRYAYVLWVLVGPLVVGIMAAHWPQALTRISLGVAVVVQVVVLFLNGNLYWSTHYWGGKWIDLEVPESLKNEPATYLLHGVQSNSFIAPYLHPDSRFSNFTGQYVQPIGARMSEKMREFLSDTTHPVRLVFEANYTPGVSVLTLDPNTDKEINSFLSGYGFRRKNMECKMILLKGSPVAKTFAGVGWVPPTLQKKDENISAVMWVCDLDRLPPPQMEKALQDYRAVDEIFDSIEDACGMALDPHRIQTVRTSTGWFRNYFNTVTVLMAKNDEIFIHPTLSMLTFPMGKLSEWSGKKVECPDILKHVREADFKLTPAEPEN
ncbi:glycosyltransferase family 39 protein [uncultured Pseudacidovorax sp.]|uniref:glycosyltransferase family 39 protein n=1 Tax=uncultured Pseudacidovorax sp. TaxID=679313 RepID=UPI0025E4B223|nr:glycosyltransferase family 39 protein [uncultured Pseudacidovorax sp.]